MPPHAELVAAFRDGLTTGRLPPGVTARDPAEAERRFAVYRNNVAHGLTRALAQRFPVVERLVGAAFFNATAGEFLRAHPPASPRLPLWGGEFPDFLAAFPPARGLPWLADVARIEWLRGLAYHAADAVPVPPAALAAADPARTGLGLHPSLAMLRSPHAAVSIWQANQPGTAPGDPIDVGRPEDALVLRDQRDRVPVLALAPGDTTFIGALAAGLPLLAAAEAARDAAPGHAPGAILATLARHGAVTSLNPTG